MCPPKQRVGMDLGWLVLERKQFPGRLGHGGHRAHFFVQQMLVKHRPPVRSPGAFIMIHSPSLSLASPAGPLGSHTRWAVQ